MLVTSQAQWSREERLTLTLLEKLHHRFCHLKHCKRRGEDHNTGQLERRNVQSWTDLSSTDNKGGRTERFLLFLVMSISSSFLSCLRLVEASMELNIFTYCSSFLSSRDYRQYTHIYQ